MNREFLIGLALAAVAMAAIYLAGFAAQQLTN
jgi:hypothetical protein